MSASSPIERDHPMKLAWDAYGQTERYANTKRWAVEPTHVDGSLWAAFLEGWNAAHGLTGEAPPPRALLQQSERKRVLAMEEWSEVARYLNAGRYCDCKHDHAMRTCAHCRALNSFRALRAKIETQESQPSTKPSEPAQTK